MNSEKSEEATRILLRRTSIPSWLNDAPPNVPPTRDFLLFLLTNISSPPPPRGIEMPPTILIKTSFTYITYYKHFALWRDALHPCPSNNTPSFRLPPLFWERGEVAFSPRRKREQWWAQGVSLKKAPSGRSRYNFPLYITRVYYFK